MRWNLRRFVIILAIISTVILLLEFIQNKSYHPNNSDRRHNVVELATKTASKTSRTISEVTNATSMPSVNIKYKKDHSRVANVETTTKSCDKINKLYRKFARYKYLSDFELDCLLGHYNIKGIQCLDRASKYSFLKCNPDYTRYGHRGDFKEYLDVNPTNLGNCTKLSDMRFINGTRVITLVSFPGSGNTWTRLLLEQATGIFTGSIFCDEDLRSRGFFGEQVISSNVLVVKTHYPGVGKPKVKHFNPTHVDGVIFIMRNPLNSIVAERKRQVLRADRHTGDIGQEYFGKPACMYLVGL